MNGNRPAGQVPDIPILMEPVPETTTGAGGNAAGGHTPSAGQQALFADLPAPSAPATTAQALRSRAAQARTTAALAELNRRAPAIITGLVDAHAGLLKGLLRERLQAELAEILRELPEEPPATS